MAQPYIAAFVDGGGKFHTAALSWRVTEGGLLPGSWWRILRTASELDIGIRLTSHPVASALLLLVSDDNEALRQALTRLRSETKPRGLREPDSAAEFDILVSTDRLPFHVRTQHDGYRHNGNAVACDFRLYTTWVGQGLEDGVGYQINLRLRPATIEQQRASRKHVAWLDIEEPFTPHVRAMQKLLASRLLAPSWHADEYFAFDSEARRDAWLDRTTEHFRATVGRVFTDPPLELGDFSDWLSSGYHSARAATEMLQPPVEGAGRFGEDEVGWLVSQSPVRSTYGRSISTPDVFISYASPDFPWADEVRRHLERQGVCCWIAPRDVGRTGMPYPEAISDALRKVKAAVVIVSDSANLSVHIPRELDGALARKLSIVPLRLANAEPEGQLEYLLRTCQWLDAFDRDWAEVLSELSVRIEHLLARHTG